MSEPTGDLVIKGCDNKDVKEVVSGALKKRDSWVSILITLEKVYPSYIPDLELPPHLELIPGLRNTRKPGDIAQNVQTFTTPTHKLAISYYEDSKALPTPPTPCSSKRLGGKTGCSREAD